MEAEGKSPPPPFGRLRDGLSIRVRVQPRSSKKAVEGLAGGALRVRLTAPPVGGAANKQLVEVLSDWLGVRKSDISITGGSSSREKTVKVSGLKAPPDSALYKLGLK